MEKQPWQKLVGRTIVAVQKTDAEMSAGFLWGGQRGLVLFLDDGTLVLPVCDAEGNAPGVLALYPPGGGVEYAAA